MTIRENELQIIENGFAQGLMQPRTPAVRSDKTVAVVGAPARQGWRRRTF